MRIDQLEQQRQDILRKIGKIRKMRRGSVTEQFFEAPRKGKTEPVRQGPYYLWQYWEHGRPRRQRLRGAPEVTSARAEVAAHREFEELCARYVRVAEELARAEREAIISEETLKKGLKSRSSRTRK